MATFFGGLGGSEDAHVRMFEELRNDALRQYAKFVKAKDAGRLRAAREAAMDFYEAASRAREESRFMAMRPQYAGLFTGFAVEAKMAEVRAFVVGGGR